MVARFIMAHSQCPFVFSNGDLRIRMDSGQEVRFNIHEHPRVDYGYARNLPAISDSDEVPPTVYLLSLSHN